MVFCASRLNPAAFAVACAADACATTEPFLRMAASGGIAPSLDDARLMRDVALERRERGSSLLLHPGASRPREERRAALAPVAPPAFTMAI